MSILSAQTSIRKALTNAVMLVTALCLSLSISISTYLDVKEQKALIVDKITILSEIIAYNAQVTVLFDDNETETERLKSFETVPLIKNIHIYAIDELSNEPVFFSSFNANRTPPVPIKVNSISELSEPKFKDDVIELLDSVEYKDWLRFNGKFIDKFIGHNKHPTTREHTLIGDYIWQNRLT